MCYNNLLVLVLNWTNKQDLNYNTWYEKCITKRLGNTQNVWLERLKKKSSWIS